METRSHECHYKQTKKLILLLMLGVNTDLGPKKVVFFLGENYARDDESLNVRSKEGNRQLVGTLLRK